MPKTVYTATAELCPDTGLYIGSIVGLQGAHSQGATLEELRDNLKEAIDLVLGEAGEIEVKVIESKPGRNANQFLTAEQEDLLTGLMALWGGDDYQ